MDQNQHPYETLIEAFIRIRVPADLLICELWLVAAILSIYLPVVSESYLRVIFGIPLVVFIPGYALIAALFPAQDDIEGIERVALSFGLSIAIVPLAGLALNYTPWGIRLNPIVTVLAVLTLALCLLAQVRRAALPETKRFIVPFKTMKKELWAEFYPREERSVTDRILSILLLAAIIIAIVTTAWVIAVPKQGETFTEFFILGEKMKAADYPDRLLTGDNRSIYIGIGNHEYRPVNYTVEIYMVNMSFDHVTNTSGIVSMDRLDRFTVPVAHNETVVQQYNFTPNTTSVNRLEFLLFDDMMPDDSVRGMERINQSYRNLHLWVTIRSR